jgi:hypothetical protein
MMLRLIRLLIVYFVLSWLFRQTAGIRQAWDQSRQNQRWEVIRDELHGAGDDALKWAEEALHQRRLRE